MAGLDRYSLYTSKFCTTFYSNMQYPKKQIIEIEISL